jgi:hypothetical protein
MKIWRSFLAIKGGCCLAASIALFSGWGTMAVAQERPAGTPDLKRDQRDREQRETMLRTMEGVAVGRLDEKRIEAAVNLIKDDFRQLQIIRNEIARHLLADKPLDFKFVSDKAGEINKRTERLKKHLMPPSREDAGKKQQKPIEFDDDQMKDVLVRLCLLIDSFVDNPVLYTPGRVDVEQSTKAGSDLLALVELSSNIRRSAEKLGKTN